VSAAAETAAERTAVPALLAISDRRTLGISDRPNPADAWAAWLAELAADGVPALQLREKDLDDRALFDLALATRRALPPPFRLLVNGRPDVALAAAADGVHLPAAGLPTAAVAGRFGALLAVGRSTHAVAEVAAARDAGAAYVTFGPVWPTPGKERYGAAKGVDGADGLAAACALGLPVIALGGVTMPERVAEAAAAGAAGVAGIRAFQDPRLRRELVAAAREAFAGRLPGGAPAGM